MWGSLDFTWVSLKERLMWVGELESEYLVGSDASLNRVMSLCDCSPCEKKWGLGGLPSKEFRNVEVWTPLQAGQMWCVWGRIRWMRIHGSWHSAQDNNSIICMVLNLHMLLPPTRPTHSSLKGSGQKRKLKWSHRYLPCDINGLLRKLMKIRGGQYLQLLEIIYKLQFKAVS